MVSIFALAKILGVIVYLKENEKKYDRKATKKTQIEKEKEQTRYAVKTWRIKTKDKVTTEAENCGRMST